MCESNRRIAIRFPTWARLCGVACSLTLALALAASAEGPAASAPASTPASASFESDEAGLTEQIIDVKDPAANLYSATMPAGDGWKMRLLIESVYDPSKNKPFDHVRSIVPLNPAGKKDGEEQFRVPYDSTVFHTVPWKDGLKDGVERLYRRGREGRNLEYEIPWKGGKIDGVKKSYFPNGDVMATASYVSGNLDGESILYSREGKVERKSLFKAGKRDGPSIDYWPSGQVKRNTPFKAGLIEGAAQEFYDSGQLKRELPHKNNLQHGVEKQYGADGKIEKTKYWIDGNETSEADFKAKFKP